MAWRAGWRGWSGAALIVGAVLASDAMAQDEPAQGEPGQDELGPRKPAAIVYFGSLEAGPAKSFVSTGSKRAFGEAGLDASGFRSLTSISASREQAGTTRPYGIAYKVDAQALIGYEWRLGETFVALYGGSDFAYESRDCGCIVTTVTRLGLRAQLDLWSTPTPETMLQASAYVSTLDSRIWARIAPGFSIQPRLYVGPEAEIYHESDYRKLRLGLHLTGLRLFGLVWRIAGGWQRTSDRPAEAYATLGVYWRK